MMERCRILPSLALIGLILSFGEDMGNLAAAAFLHHASLGVVDVEDDGLAVGLTELDGV